MAMVKSLRVRKGGRQSPATGRILATGCRCIKALKIVDDLG